MYIRFDIRNKTYIRKLVLSGLFLALCLLLPFVTGQIQQIVIIIKFLGLMLSNRKPIRVFNNLNPAIMWQGFLTIRGLTRLWGYVIIKLIQPEGG